MLNDNGPDFDVGRSRFGVRCLRLRAIWEEIKMADEKGQRDLLNG